jgi:RNA polymerase sigma-70 factor, ECF subfamily
MDEQEAIQILKRGDISGLEILVACYQVKAIRTAYLITRDPHLAQDVAQDVFLQVYRSISGFDSKRPFEPWFMRSVVNAALKAAQKTAKQLPAGSDDDNSWLQNWPFEQEYPTGTRSVEGQIESAEFHEIIWEAMRELSPRQRAVIVQRYFLEMSEKEMAEELETAPGTVKWLLNAARERLRSLLGSERSAR